MDKWILIWHDEEYDIERALNENALVTWPQSGDMHSGDTVYFYDPDSDEVVYKATVEEADLTTMDEETMDYVLSVSFYDGANRYVRLRPEEVGSDIKVDEDSLRNAGVDLTYSSRLTPEQAALFGDSLDVQENGEASGGETDRSSGIKDDGDDSKAALSQYKKGDQRQQTAGIPESAGPSSAQDFFGKNKKALTRIAAAAALIAVLCIGYFNIHIYDPPTCEAPAVCKICGKEVKPATGHDWDGGKVIKTADCDHEGIMKYTCRNDPSHVEEESIPKTAHDWDNGYVVYSATCESDGLRKFTCKNYSSHVKEVSIPKKGHDWDDGYLIQSPGCTTYGIMRYTCRNDSSHTMEKSLPPEGHIYRAATYKSPETCVNCKKTRGERLGIKRDVEFSDEDFPRRNLSNGLYVYPKRLSRKVYDCREIKLAFKVKSKSKIFGKKWKVYLRCNGDWVYKGKISLKNGKKKSKVIRFDTPADVDGVYIIPTKIPKKRFSWSPTYWISYVQETVY